MLNGVHMRVFFKTESLNARATHFKNRLYIPVVFFFSYSKFELNRVEYPHNLLLQKLYWDLYPGQNVTSLWQPVQACRMP